MQHEDLGQGFDERSPRKEIGTVYEQVQKDKRKDILRIKPFNAVCRIQRDRLVPVFEEGAVEEAAGDEKEEFDERTAGGLLDAVVDDDDEFEQDLP